MSILQDAGSPAPELWQATPGLDLHWLDWGADSVVYDSESGHTYKFSPLAAAVMACVEDGPRSMDDLRAQLDLDDAADEASASQEVDAALAAVLERFVALNWIELNRLDEAGRAAA